MINPPKPTWTSDCGRVILYRGDCLPVLAHLDNIQAVITDPPYGDALKNNGGFGWRGEGQLIENDHDQATGQAALDWAEKRGIATIAFAKPSKPWAGAWRSRLVWDKGPAVGGGGDIKTCWKPTWELIQVARNGPLSGDRDSAVLKYWIGPNNYHNHPNEKPLSLMMYLVGKLKADVVLDPFMGSGTTGLACIKTGRRFIGIELDPKHYETAKRRIKEELEANIFLSA